MIVVSLTIGFRKKCKFSKLSLIIGKVLPVGTNAPPPAPMKTLSAMPKAPPMRESPLCSPRLYKCLVIPLPW